MKINWVELESYYPFLKDIESITKQVIEENLVIKNFKANEEISSNRCAGFSFVLKGGLQIYRISDSGREVYLYKVGVGDTCFLSLSCIINSSNYYPAMAKTIAPTTIAFIPHNLFEKYLAKNPVFWRFNFESLYSKYYDVIETLDAIAFTSIDQRLIEYLITHTTVSAPTLTITHEEIANELGSTRETISRLLSKLKEQKILSLRRGSITITNFELLLTQKK